MKEFIALIVAEVVEVSRNIHLHKLEEANAHAWKAVYLASALEFDIYPELKEKIMPLRRAVEKLTKAPEKGLQVFRKDWFEIYDLHNKAHSEVMVEIRKLLKGEG